MTWNYRVLKTNTGFGVYEIYYDEDAKPISYSAQGVSPRGETYDELSEDFLLRYRDAFEKPVLTVTENDELVELD